MTPPINLLPTFYLDADVRNVTPVCPGRERMGLDLPGQPTVRVAITRGARAVSAPQATRRFYGPSPNMGSILGQLSGTRTRPLRTDGPNAACCSASWRHFTSPIPASRMRSTSRSSTFTTCTGLHLCRWRPQP